MADFLLEIGTEEIPDWMIEPALEDLRTRFQSAFAAFGGSALGMDGTPRRLVLTAKDLLEQAPDVQSVVQGPYLSAGEKAAEGFARKQGTKVADLAKLSDSKGERYVFHQLTKGQSAVEALSAKLPEIVGGIHFPKAMYWTKKSDVRFIRPIRWIVALLGDQVVPFGIAGVKSGDKTRGHRILGAKEPVRVTVASYREVLRENFVIVSAKERQQRIEAGLSPQVHHDPELLKTLVYLTEFPTTIHGSFDPSYLELPKEILSTVMRHHQRYFSVLKPDGSLAPQFVAVTNTDGDPDGLIRQGNERVLRARFNDAQFFWNSDQTLPLKERYHQLSSVTFLEKLGDHGDYAAKTDRIVALAASLSVGIADTKVCRDAAHLCKCDLTTDMVKEFTDLQGIVGGLYAAAQEEGEEVATAIYDHYKPTSMEDSIPRTLEGQILSIADKTDTLRVCFKIGLVPTGSKDPLALRRAAQGIVKILFEARLKIGLVHITGYEDKLFQFLLERIQHYLREVRGYPYDEVNAITKSPGLTTLADMEDRIEVLHSIRPTADFESIAASFKRIANILAQAQLTWFEPPDRKLLSPGPEQDLYAAFLRIRDSIKESSSYRDRLAAIASLRPQVDLFFDKILVNDPDPAIRQNRLALLRSVLDESSNVAVFSEIVTQGASGV